MKPSAVDFADVQGLVRYGYDDLKEACYFVLRITDRAAARAWLAEHKFTSVTENRSPATVLQVAFTFGGLKALGVSLAIQDGFPHDFRSGMIGEEARSRRLGDVGRNDPKHWDWGGPRSTGAARAGHAVRQDPAGGPGSAKSEIGGSNSTVATGVRRACVPVDERHGRL